MAKWALLLLTVLSLRKEFGLAIKNQRFKQFKNQGPRFPRLIQRTVKTVGKPSKAHERRGINETIQYFTGTGTVQNVIECGGYCLGSPNCEAFVIERHV